MIRAEVNGRLARWQYDVGALVQENEMIGEIETDDGLIRLYAPASGRLTEMLALPGDSIEAGQVIGWIDAITDEETPQSISALLDQPVERKPKPKRKPRTRSIVMQSPWFWMLAGLLLAVGVSGLVTPTDRVQRVQLPVVQTVIVTSLAPMPTPRYRQQERVILREPVEELQWGTQGNIQYAEYSPGSGTWYMVKFGDKVIRVPESNLDSVSVLAPTPTLRFDYHVWNWSYPLVLKEPVADFPAGTKVHIGAAMFNGVEWEIQVTTENGVSLNVRESQLEVSADAPDNPAVTPTLSS